MKGTGTILRAIFDSTDDVWFYVSPEYSVIFFNQKAFKNGITLHNRELKAGDNILDYARDTQNNIDARFAKSFKEALKGEIVTVQEQIIYASTTMWFRSKYVPVYEGKTLKGVSITVSDITREKLLEIDQLESKKKVEELLKKREEFMSIASHELKTPITGIKGLLQLLYRKAKTEQLSFFENMLKKANQHVDKLNQLVNDLLDVTRIDSGKLALNLQEVNLEDILEDSIFILHAEGGSHDINIVGNPNIHFKADKNRLEQVICNILSNALKYSDAGSEITISVEANTDWIIVSIIDQGIGIPQDKIDSIFDRFYRVDEANFNKSGLGLGLYISSDIIKNHHGRIEVQSEPGKGSNFSIYLPAH